MLARMRLFDPDAPPPAPPPDPPADERGGLVAAYLAHLAAVDGLAAATRANHGLYLRHFLAWWERARPGADPTAAAP